MTDNQSDEFVYDAASEHQSNQNKEVGQVASSYHYEKVNQNLMPVIVPWPNVDNDFDQAWRDKWLISQVGNSDQNEEYEDDKKEEVFGLSSIRIILKSSWVLIKYVGVNYQSDAEFTLK